MKPFICHVSTGSGNQEHPYPEHRTSAARSTGPQITSLRLYGDAHVQDTLIIVSCTQRQMVPLCQSRKNVRMNLADCATTVSLSNERRNPHGPTWTTTHCGRCTSCAHCDHNQRWDRTDAVYVNGSADSVQLRRLRGVCGRCSLPIDVDDNGSRSPCLLVTSYASHSRQDTQSHIPPFAFPSSFVSLVLGSRLVSGFSLCCTLTRPASRRAEGNCSTPRVSDTS
jgi:hypothetical protein